MMFVAPYVDVGRNVAKASKMNDGMEILIFSHICSCVVYFHMATARYFSHGKCITFKLANAFHLTWKMQFIKHGKRNFGPHVNYISFSHVNYSSLHMETTVQCTWRL